MKTILFFRLSGCLLVLPWLLLSCEKKIEINPKESEAKIVIQAYLYNDSVVKVSVSKTISYLSTTKPAVLSTATATLSDNTGHSETLSWNPFKQRYESAVMKGVIDQVYTLTVVCEGKTYTSTSVLPHLPVADSIHLQYMPKTIFGEEGYHMLFYGTDPPAEKNFYLFKGYADDSLMNKPTEIYFADDKFIDGSVNGIDARFVYTAKDVTQVAKLELYSLTAEAYNFYNVAYAQIHSDGGFFSTPPANVPSMFDNGALGIFQCSMLQALYATVPKK